MSAIYRLLRSGPLLIAEVRGFRAEVGKKFDKSDKNAPPITFGVFNIHLELLSDGAPVILSIYPGATVELEKLGEQLQLKRGALVAVSVGKLENKSGQRRAVCAPGGIRVLSQDDARAILAA
jgi:hypothetical protein